MVFTQAQIITNGGPVNETLVYILYLYQNSFKYYEMGYGSAMAWILLVIVGFFTAAGVQVLQPMGVLRE